MVYMLGLLPFPLRILMEVRVTTRKTTRATERPTRREKSVSNISCAENKGNQMMFINNTALPKKGKYFISFLFLFTPVHSLLSSVSTASHPWTESHFSCCPTTQQKEKENFFSLNSPIFCSKGDELDSFRGVFGNFHLKNRILIDLNRFHRQCCE